MKRISIAAALAFCATGALAQAPVSDVPTPKCGPKPVFPSGTTNLAGEARRRAFERDIETYKACMMKYIDDRKAATLANQSAYTAAIAEYNETMTAINAAVEAAREPPSGVR
jgi:hypothetical protein